MLSDDLSCETMPPPQDMHMSGHVDDPYYPANVLANIPAGNPARTPRKPCDKPVRPEYRA